MLLPPTPAASLPHPFQIIAQGQTYTLSAADARQRYSWFNALLAAGVTSPDTTPSEMVERDGRNPRTTMQEALRSAFSPNEDEEDSRDGDAAPTAEDDSRTSLPRPSELITRGLPHPDADEVLSLMLALEQDARLSSDVQDKLERIRGMWQRRA